MSRTAGRMASDAVPFSGAVRTVQQAVDPVVRQPRSIAETVKAGIPGLSESVEPRIDRFGREVVREGGPMRRALDPLNTSSVVDDPIAGELARLVPVADSLGLEGWPLSLPSRKVTGKGIDPLTREQETAAMKARGQAVRAAAERVIQSSSYQRMTDEQRARALDRAIDTARRRSSQAYARTVKRQQFAARARVPGTPVPGRPGASRPVVNKAAARAGRIVAEGVPGTSITRAELESLIPDLSETAGESLTYEDVRAEAERRGLRVVER